MARTFRQAEFQPLAFERLSPDEQLARSPGQEIKVKHYYSEESVGIAVGMFLCSLHLAGLATLTHTPSPMAFLGEILQRPQSTSSRHTAIRGELMWLPGGG